MYANDARVRPSVHRARNSGLVDRPPARPTYQLTYQPMPHIYCYGMAVDGCEKTGGAQIRGQDDRAEQARGPARPAPGPRVRSSKALDDLVVWFHGDACGTYLCVCVCK